MRMISNFLNMIGMKRAVYLSDPCYTKLMYVDPYTSGKQ